MSHLGEEEKMRGETLQPAETHPYTIHTDGEWMA